MGMTHEQHQQFWRGVFIVAVVMVLMVLLFAGAL